MSSPYDTTLHKQKIGTEEIIKSQSGNLDPFKEQILSN